jgi:hypothetical protein
MMICAALKENNMVTRLQLSQNNIRARGAQAIGQLLKLNTAITEYVPSECSAGILILSAARMRSH